MMNIRKAFKYRLYPSSEQAQRFAVQFGCARFVYNHFLNVRKQYYATHKDNSRKKGLSYVDTNKMLTLLKREPDREWLRDADSQVLQEALRNLNRAYENFFRRVKSRQGKPGYPRFKSRKGKQSIRYPQRVKYEGNRTYLPKVGWVKTIFHRPLEGTPKSVTVSKTKSGKYFVSVLCEVEIPDPPRRSGEVGVDVGLKYFAVTSDGGFFSPPQHLLNAEKRLGRLQRRLSRRQKGSAGWERMRQQVARLHEKVANQRRDFHHKLSSYLVGKYGAIYLEDLNVRGMVRNRRLAKHISDAGWSQFAMQLAYKGEWYGCSVEKIDRFAPSSKTCSACGTINHGLMLKNRSWVCPKCGAHLERDLNAATNILNFSRAGAARSNAGGESVSLIPDEPFSAKPEAQLL
jgi:putative transposase